MSKEFDEIVRGVVEDLTNKGQLIEAGWASLQLLGMKEGASAQELTVGRLCFFAGAHRAFASILDSLSLPPKVMRERLDLMAVELNRNVLAVRKEADIEDKEGENVH